MIQINNLEKKYGETIACDIPELHIQKGERIGLVGNNGAGKTTVISLLLDLIKADQGSVAIGDLEVSETDDWKQFVAAYLDENFLIDYLTAEEYFDFIAGARGISKEQLEERLSPFSTFFRDQVLGTKKYIRDLSKGNKKKVGVVGALIGQPELLILDEPFANLDPSTQLLLKQMLIQVSDKMTILVSSHDLSHIIDVCDRIILIEKGKIVKDLKTEENTLKELESYFIDK